MEQIEENYCIFGKEDVIRHEGYNKLPPPPKPKNKPKNHKYTFPVEKGIMILDTEYGGSHLLQLSYIIVSPNGSISTISNFYFDHPTEFDSDGDRTSFWRAVRIDMVFCP